MNVDRHRGDDRNGHLARKPQTDRMDTAWIRNGLKKPGKTQAGLARAFRRDPAAISRLLAGDRQLKADEIAIIENYLEVRAPDAVKRPRSSDDQAEAVKIPVMSATNFARNIPVYGVAAGGSYDNVPFDFNTGTTVDYVRRPPRLEGVNAAYGLYIVGDSMSPWREPGQLIYAHPGQPCNIGDYVIVHLRPQEEGDGSPILIKKLVRRTEKELRLLQYNPSKEIAIPTNRVTAIHKVLEWTDIMGS